MRDIIGNKTIPKRLEEMTHIYPNKTFVVFEDQNEATVSLTYEEFTDQVRRLAQALQNYGIQKGDKVLLHLPNSMDFMISWFAITSIGGIMVPTNILSTANEIAYLLEHSETKLVITETDYVDKFASFQKRLNGIFLSRSYEDRHDGVSLQKLIDQTEPLKTFPDLSSDDVAAILYTSGTTSKPKGVLVTHANYIYAGEIMSKSLRMSPEDRVLIVLPIFHGNGQYYMSMPALSVGASIAITERFSASKYFKQAKRLQATVGSLFAAPIKMILKKPYDPHDAEHSLRLIVFAQSVTIEQLQAFEDRYRVPLRQLYGMTETIGTPLINPLDGNYDNLSIGLPSIGYQVKLVDDNGMEVPDGETGQIVVSGVPGRTIMKGYFQNEEATNKTIIDGWLYTGDLAKKDPTNGYFYFVDRKKDMIKRAGENVAASEVESVIHQHEAVFESAVIGIPDEIRDEAIHAFIVLKNGYDISPQEIIDFCTERLSAFKVPEAVHFIEEFPRTSVGKIQKHQLKNYISIGR
ncbi:class I adenylate-forming enzyme family protein [Bacillus alveayuensis]|uniref:Crotonobetaine/carnitine-CoA ligase n=1 Tax=Aeribacillus alveayuensis TaxID=279215 RepID=A0ABT9VQU8_9BACI|nr:AMP-binding protein [Bacillus alveayuensis]MDQ0163356.1 crotonobetaine/carnitine-CoA ligase [Bacillus alveayuensis]